MADRRTILTVLFCLAAILCTLQSPRLYAQSPAARPLTPEQKAAELKAIEQKQQAAQPPRPKAVAEIPATPQLTAAQRAALLAAAQRQQPTQPPLRITLSDNPRAPYAGQPVLVIATPDHPISNVTYFFEWGDRSDNTSSRVPQASHTYASAGNYLVTVQLRATETMRQAPVSSTLTVIVNRQQPIQPPTNNGSNQIVPRPKPPALQVALNSYPPAPYAGQSDRITATPTYPISNARYQFDWGDRTPSTTSNEPQAPHTYVNPGTYNVIVQVRALANDNDVAARNTLTLLVNPPPPPPPPTPTPAPTPTPTYTAPTPTPTYTTPTPTTSPTPTPTSPTPTPNTTLTLTASQTHALPGQPINFTVASDPPTGFTQFQYQFGDADPPGIPGPNGVQHAYSQPGTYYASASTQSADGQSTLTSNEVQLQIAAAPLPELTLDLVTANPVAKGSTVLDASLDPRDADETYRFDWGDGTPADSVGILGRGSHTYANPGSYTVSVIATTNGGNIPGQKEITVSPPTSPPIPILPIVIALLLAGTIAGWAYHHFRAPTGELHTTFGVSHTASNQLSIPTSAPHLALTFKNGVEASDHNIRFL